jgi:hypothetical protein
MPQPFRLYNATAIALEKILLIESADLYLAIPANRVQEVLLKVEVIQNAKHSLTAYKEAWLPTILGMNPSPSLAETTVAVLQAEVLKPGFLAIACTQFPQLAALAATDWQEIIPLSQVWQSEAKGYSLNGKTYIYTTGIAQPSSRRSPRRA